MVRMEGVRFRYGKKAPLFDGLNLELQTDTIYGLLGKNGAGKTTLLKLLCGLRFPEAGVIDVAGYVPEQRAPGLLEELFLIPEEFAVPPVRVSEYARRYGPLYPRFNANEFESYVSEFELDRGEKLSEMSYGQKKKTMLAFGMATNTRLLLLDEPTNGLDIPSKGQFRRLLAGAAGPDRAIVVSTHQVRDMENLIDPIVILEEGAIIFNFSLDDVINRLTMGVAAEKPDDALYSERAMGGFAVVQENRDRTPSRVDLELLFNAVTSDPARISSVLAQEVAV